MNFLAIFSFVIIHVISKVEITQAETCTVPNEGNGTCVKISNCPPIAQLFTKKDKTDDERLFLHQSFCGSRDKRSPRRNHVSVSLSGVSVRIQRKKKVCCPTLTESAQFQPIPDKSETPDSEDRIVSNAGNEKKLFDYGEVVSGARFCGVDTSSTNKITGGSVTSVDQYPWLVLLEYTGGGLDCGGSLISSRFVLTAAHCVSGRSGSPIIARLGEYNTTSFPTDIVPVRGGGFEKITVQLIRVDRAIAHAEYDRIDLKNDIALVKLAQNAVFSDFVKAVCLPGKNFIPSFNLATKLTVAGWGEDPNDRRFDDVKKDVYVPYVPLDECERSRSNKLSDAQVCAGGEEGKDTCQGDSGGPLMYEYKQVYIIIGITSYGPRNCGTKGEPGVYTNVYKYLDWIKDVLEGRITF